LDVKGKEVCGYCKGDIAAMANKAGVNSITIHARDDDTGAPKVYIWEKGMKKVVESKKQ